MADEIDARGREIHLSWLRAKWNDYADRLVGLESRVASRAALVRLGDEYNNPILEVPHV